MPEFLFGARQIAAIQPDLAHLIADVGVLWIDLQIVLEPRQRRIVVSETAVRLREVDHGEVVVRLEAECLLEVLNGLRRITVAEILVAHHEPGIDHLRIFPSTSLSSALISLTAGLLVRSFPRQVRGSAELVEETDLVLGIGAPRSRL